MSQVKDPLYVRSVEKAFSVLEVFLQEPKALSLRDVSRLTGYDKSTAQRFCHTLHRLGYLQRVQGSSAFVLAPKVTELNAGFANSNPLVRRARPYLRTLNAETQSTVSLSVLDGHEVLFIARFLGGNVLDTTVTVGSRLPIYCTASGRALASLLDDEQLEAVLQHQSWEACTSKTELDYVAVKTAILEGKQQGYVVTSDQFVMSDLSLAVPFYDQESDLFASVNLSVSTARYQPEEVVEQYAKLLQTTVRSIAS